MKTYFSCACFLFVFLNSFAQSKKVRDNIYQIFKELYSKTNYICIADTTINSFPYTTNELRYAVNHKDTLLLKEILDKGEKKTISGREVEEIIKMQNRRKSRTDFFSIHTPAINLTEQEENVLKSIDSVGQLKHKYLRDSAQYRKLNKQEEKLFAAKEYLSYKRKLQKSDKRLLFFPPLYHYKNFTLLTISCYKSLTDGYLIARIIADK